MASNEYLDFGAHVPLIRSFSKGNNFPPELPFYSGQPIFYHFLFDFTTALFEKTGWSVALAYNFLSALSLTFLFIFIFYFSQKIFGKKSWLLGFFSGLFFLLTPDLSFLYFFKKHGLTDFLTNLRNHNLYLNNGLTVDKFFGGFFNINVFTNQRHLVFGFGMFALFMILLSRLSSAKVQTKTIFFAGLTLGLLPFWHNFVFLAVCLVYSAAWFFSKSKKTIFNILIIAFLVALPQLLFIRSQTGNQIVFRPGFLIHDNLSLFNFVKFWFYNFGIGLPLMIAGWLIAPKNVKRFFWPFLFLFVVPNIFGFAREPFNDHKFFNLFIIFGNMLSVWFLLFLWRKNLLFKGLVLACLVFFTASGFLNLLVVKNDVWVKFPDVPKSPFLKWVEENTDVQDVFLTNLGIWDPVNLTGRKKFLGRPHYLWAYGANPSARMAIKKAILAGEAAMKEINQAGINFFAFSKEGEEFNSAFFEKFPQVYQDENWLVYQFVLESSL